MSFVAFIVIRIGISPVIIHLILVLVPFIRLGVEANHMVLIVSRLGRVMGHQDLCLGVEEGARDVMTNQHLGRPQFVHVKLLRVSDEGNYVFKPGSLLHLVIVLRSERLQ